MDLKSFEFYFEFASTYSYLAASRIQSLANSVNIKISWRPFLLGPIFKFHGWDDSPFNIYPLKGKYMWRDMERQCEKYGLSFKRPSKFPRNGLLAARVACLLQEKPQIENFVRRVYEANFVHDLEISDRKVIADMLSKINLDPEGILLKAQSEEIKSRLRHQTEKAKNLGIFGAPTVVIGQEIYWGNDRLEDAIGQIGQVMFKNGEK